MSGPFENVNPPKQSRSQRTLERLVDASLEILATEGPDGLTVHAVVDRAGSSVGSFYARFRGKEELLAYLGDRIWDDALQRWRKARDERDWGAVEVGELMEGSVRLLVDAQRSRSAYLKAIDAAASKRHDAYERFRTEIASNVGELLLERRSDIVHESPELAVRLGLRAVLGVIDAEARATHDRLEPDVLVEECTTLLSGYLLGTGGSGGASVDFFDVWG